MQRLPPALHVDAGQREADFEELRHGLLATLREVTHHWKSPSADLGGESRSQIGLDFEVVDRRVYRPVRPVLGPDVPLTATPAL